MLALLCTVLLSAPALAWNDGPIPPHLRKCANLSIVAAGNCPKFGYECDPTEDIVYKGHHGRQYVRCANNNAELAVGEQIVESVRCSHAKWRATNDDDVVETTSAVCAKSCDQCRSHSHHAPDEYEELEVIDPSEDNKCAIAQCEFGFVALSRNGTLLAEFPSNTLVTCTGNRMWQVTSSEAYRNLMCKKEVDACATLCDNEPWELPALNATSPALRTGCNYSCPTGQVLSRTHGDAAITTTSATCTCNGFLLDDGHLVKQIGCSTCDVADGPHATIDHAVSTGCVLACSPGYRLRYGLGSGVPHTAHGNKLFRQFSSTKNTWITFHGFVLTPDHYVDCVRK